MISIALGEGRGVFLESEIEKIVYIDVSKFKEELNQSIFIIKQPRKYIMYMHPHIEISTSENGYSFSSHKVTQLAKKYRYRGIYKDFTNEFSLLDYYFTSYYLYVEYYNYRVPSITHAFKCYNHFSPIA